MITLLTKFTPKDAQTSADMKALLLELRQNVPKEQGYLSYVLLTSPDDALTLWVLESWETQADADRHGALVASNGAVERATPLLASPLETATVTPVA